MGIVAGLLVLAFVAAIMTFIWALSARDTAAAGRHDLHVQDRSKVRWGVVYVDRDDPRVWVPRPHGNGWDPNLGSTGGRLVVGAFVAVLLLVVLVPVVAGRAGG